MEWKIELTTNDQYIRSTLTGDLNESVYKEAREQLKVLLLEK